MNITSTKAITDPVHTGNHPINVKKMMLKNEETGIVTSAEAPRVAIRTTINNPIVTINDEIIPASFAVTFMKSETFSRY